MIFPRVLFFRDWMARSIRRDLPILQGETSLMADGVAHSIGEQF
jgi:hypothetical protein